MSGGISVDATWISRSGLARSGRWAEVR